MAQKIKMQFPDTFEEFVKSYSFVDDKEVYTNGCELIPTFRLKQWEEHKENEKQQLISFLEDKIKEYKLCFPTVVKALQEILDFVNKGDKE